MHKALYRIYRPKHFDEIVGQSHIVKVLENQINTSTLSHAYLFTGPRGTGKTSTAKLFAKAVNCIGDSKPCYQCKVCADSDIDIHELDAASNNSVDNIREIRDNVSFSPNVGAYKIYIIDEVHMLSGGAFNALLKTLEEPPEHVIFILATTEPHKIPQTVLSRCQKFDFRKIDHEAAKNLLIEVLNKENHSFTEDAIDFIVKKSEGGMRDALMLLDKALSFGQIDIENVELALGELSQSELAEFMSIIEERNCEKALSFVEAIDQKGVDVKVFLMDAIEYIKNAMMEKLGLVTKDKNKVTNLSPDQMASYIESLCEIHSQLRYAPLPKLLLQANLVRLLNQGTDTVDLSEIRQLREEISKLKSRIQQIENEGVALNQFPTKSKPKPTTTVAPRFLPEMTEQISQSEQENLEKYSDMLIEVIKSLKQEKKAPVAAFLEKSSVARVMDDSIILVYNEGDHFYKDALENGKIPLVEDLWKRKYNQEVKVITAFRHELPNFKKEEKHDTTLEMLKTAFPDAPIEIK